MTFTSKTAGRMMMSGDTELRFYLPLRRADLAQIEDAFASVIAEAKQFITGKVRFDSPVLDWNRNGAYLVCGIGADVLDAALKAGFHRIKD